MVKVIWTQRSLTDLKSIAEYISQDSIKYASLTIERLINVTSYLETNPKIGRMVPEMRKQNKIREIIYGNYRIIYKITSNQTVHIS
jgi:toxin ParE1/3/4